MAIFYVEKQFKIKVKNSKKFYSFKNNCNFMQNQNSTK